MNAYEKIVKESKENDYQGLRLLDINALIVVHLILARLKNALVMIAHYGGIELGMKKRTSYIYIGNARMNE